MLNWKIRYSKILERNRDLFDVSRTVLEVGSGSVGVAPYVGRKIIGLEPSFTEPVNEWLSPTNGNILDIPFPDNSFDIVLCVDVFEHLSRADRPRALSQLVRVARDKIIIACPCGQFSERGERALATLFQNARADIPIWLKEHLDNGLPSVGDMLGYIANTGIEFEILGNETMMQHYAGILLDYVFPFAREMQDIQSRKSPVAPPVGEGDWDLYYSFAFTLKKNSTERPAIELIKKPIWSYDFDINCHEAQIYSIYHKPFPTAHLEKIKPIYAGPAGDLPPPGALTDITECEARLPNGRWSELSAYYKVWREGPRSEIVGFCHYRRLFNFCADNLPGRQSNLSHDDLAVHSSDFYDEKLIEQARDDVVICPRPMYLGMTIWDQYCLTHNSKDWCSILGMISTKYPDLLPHVIKQFTESLLYANNIFITNWALFDQICYIWFDLLRDFERVTPLRESGYQRRDISFLAERIFDAWIRYRVSMGTRIIEVPIFYVESA